MVGQVTATQELLFGVTGQSFILDAPEPVSSVNTVSVFEIYADDTTEAEQATTGAASRLISAASTNAAAGPSQGDQTRIPVASVTNMIPGRRYSLASGVGAGEWEVFELASYETGYLYARHPLVNDYASGSIVADLRWSISASSTWVADVNNISSNATPNARYRVEWDVELATGERRIYETNADLVRHASTVPVTPIDVVAAYGGWLDLLGPDDRKTQGRRLIVEAARLLKFDLFRRGIADQATRNTEVRAALIIARTIYLSLEEQARAGAVALDQVEAARLQYDSMLKGLADTPVLALDKTGGGGATTTTGRSMSLWRR